MLKFVLVCGLFVVASAGSYGGGGGSGSSYGGGSGGGSSYGSGGGSGGSGVPGFGGGPVTAAVQSTHTVEIRHVNVPHEQPQPQIVEVEAGNLPLTIHFKSASSALNVVQTHQAGVAGEPQHTSSEDEPHRLVHEVTKPVIQEVREVITPYRRVIQEIKPVQEEIQTIIAKGEPRNSGGDGGSGGSGFGGGHSGGSGGFGGGMSLGGGGSGYGSSKSSGGGSYAAASNPPSAVASPRSSSKSSSGSSGISYFSDERNSGVQYVASSAPASRIPSHKSASSASVSPSSSSASSADYSGNNQIRILEGGSSRSTGLSGINAYRKRA